MPMHVTHAIRDTVAKSQIHAVSWPGLKAVPRSFYSLVLPCEHIARLREARNVIGPGEVWQWTHCMHLAWWYHNGHGRSLSGFIAATAPVQQSRGGHMIDASRDSLSYSDVNLWGPPISVMLYMLCWLYIICHHVMSCLHISNQCSVVLSFIIIIILNRYWHETIDHGHSPILTMYLIICLALSVWLWIMIMTFFSQLGATIWSWEWIWSETL